MFVSGGDFRIVNNLPSQPDELMRARMVSIKETCRAFDSNIITGKDIVSSIRSNFCHDRFIW